MSETLSPLRRIWPASVWSVKGSAWGASTFRTKVPSAGIWLSLGGLLDLDSIVNDEVHKLVKALSSVSC